MEHSNSVGAFVSGGKWVFVKYFWDQCLLGTLFQITEVRNASWKSEISGFAEYCCSVGQV
jgi:hypothetical protein